MKQKVIIFFLLFCVVTLAIAQLPQTKKEIELYRNLKIRSVRTIIVDYNNWASSPEEQITSIDSSSSLKIFDTLGRITKEYINSGINTLRYYIYNSQGLLAYAISFYSDSDVYPKFNKPKEDAEYHTVYRKIIYSYGKDKTLKESFVQRGGFGKHNRTIFTFDKNDNLVSQIEFEPNGNVYQLTINKYLNGRVDYKIHNNDKTTQTMEYSYKMEGKLVVSSTIIYGDKERSLTSYNSKEEPISFALYSKDSMVRSRTEYAYCPYGIKNIRWFSLPIYNSNLEPKTDKLRVFRDIFYDYKTY